MIFIYEDEYYKNLLPLVYTRPGFDLRCGYFTVLERIRRFYPAETIVLLVRDYLVPLTEERFPQYSVQSLKYKISDTKTSVLFLSSRAILTEKIPIEGEEEILVETKSTGEKSLIGFRIKPGRLKGLTLNTKTIARLGLKEKPVKARSINYLWDLITLNAEFLKSDFTVGQVKGILDPKAIIEGDLSRLYLESNARIEPGVILNLRSGPISVAENAKIRSLSFVEGPCYIGKNTIIDGAKIRPNCSFGDNCRIGGEVEASIFQGLANKHHEGFLGHSYIGEWVNLGALTTNSDLRNDYRSVKLVINNKTLDSGLTKLGCFIGDHSKTAIGTLLNTGTVIGIFANHFEPGLSPKVIPSFSWGSKKRWQIDEALLTAKTMMARRNVFLTKNYENLIRYLYNHLTR